MKFTRKMKLILAPLLVVAFFAGFFTAELIVTRRSAEGGDDAAAVVTLYEAGGTSDGSSPASAAPEGSAPEDITANGTATELPTEPPPDPSATSVPPGDEDGGELAVLKAQIIDIIGTLDSQWDVYIERLSDGRGISCSRNLPEDGRMISASIIKVFVMGAVYEQISLGTIDEADVAGDLKLMITVSDNDATNRLIRLLGGGESERGFRIVNTFAAGLGCSHTRLNRLMLDWSEGLENYTSGKDCATLLRLIYEGQCVSGDYSAKMMELLKAQEKNEGMKWPIPKGTAVASKPGFISGVSVGDVGIVFTAEADYILCVICNKPYSDDGAKQAIADISKAAYDYFTAA